MGILRTMVNLPDRPAALLQFPVGHAVRKTKNASWGSSVQYVRLDLRVGLTVHQFFRLEGM